MTNAMSVSDISVNRKKDGVFIEGELGLIEEIELIEGRVLMIKGVNGTIRIDLTREELQLALRPVSSSQ